MTTALLHRSKIQRSLLAEMTTFGVDDWLFIANLQVALLVAVMLRVKAWIFVALALHFVLMVVTRLAPQILGSYIKHLRQADRYFSGTSPLQRYGRHPKLAFPVESLS